MIHSGQLHARPPFPWTGRSRQQTILIVATVAGHLRAFHLPWAAHLRKQGYRVCGAASDISGCPDCQTAFDEVQDIPFSRNPFDPRQIVLAASQLRQLRRRLGATLVHFHTPNAAFWGRLALRREVQRGECRVAYTAHGFHFHQLGNRASNSFYRIAERTAARHTHALLTINSEDWAQAQGLVLAPGGFHEQIPGAGLDPGMFDPDAYDSSECRLNLTRSLGLRNGSKLVLMVAEFSRGKRHRDALSAFADRRLAGATLLLAGDGKWEKDTRRLAQRLGVEKRVVFLGHRKDVPQLLTAADAVILPSEREGLPVSVLEAMAMQKPVIVSDIRGSRELVKPACGWMHPVGDSESLASLIRLVLDNPAEAAARGSRARQRVLSNFTWPTLRQKLEEVYWRLGVPAGPPRLSPWQSGYEIVPGQAALNRRPLRAGLQPQVNRRSEPSLADP